MFVMKMILIQNPLAIISKNTTWVVIKMNVQKLINRNLYS